MSPRMAGQTCDMLQMVLKRKTRPGNVIVHTDGGGKYCSTDHHALQKLHNLRESMGAKGNGDDDARVESFFHLLKVECV